MTDSLLRIKEVKKNLSDVDLNAPKPQGKALLRLRDVRKLVPLSRPTIYRRIREGLFPAPVKDGRCSFWDEDEVKAYAEKLLGQRPPAENQEDQPTTA